MIRKVVKVDKKENCNDFCIIGKECEDGSMKYIHFRHLAFVTLPEKEGAHRVKCCDVVKFISCLRGFKNQGFVGIKVED